MSRRGQMLACLMALFWAPPAQAQDAGLGIVEADASVTAASPQPPPASDAGAVAARAADARPLPAWAPKLSATVKPATVSVGDPVKVTIKVRYGPGVAVNLPLKLELDKFSELSREEPKPTPVTPGDKTGARERTFVVKVAAYELGKLTLPSIEVTALGPGSEMVSLKTPSLPILVKSVMPNEPNPKLKELAPPVSVFMRTWWLLYAIFAVAGIGLVVALTLIISRRMRARREAAKPPPPPIPPHVIALGRLAALDTEAHIADETYKELYLQLSEIVREYVGGRWGFDALEMTTREINHALQARFVDAGIRQRLDGFFANSDLVKFAKYRPDPQGARQARVEAEKLVRETSAQEALVREPEAGAREEGQDQGGQGQGQGQGDGE